ncbi:uncharacterized protein IL334_003399 [Kwoniella shivajii]|uniref:Uncharacterized protein n=1 Tax=Kwoniella shivajii TaxID=564305 RepID=A0ABZ1CXG3_9TREE|nr:hypothetical protein IL334_003399 [Kwoniella shivajii]
MLHDTVNTALELEFSVLEINLRNMWYQHGYTGLRYFQQHIADIYQRFQLLVDEDRVDPDTVRAAETACNDLLALQAVPNQTWLPYVTGIRRRLSQSGESNSNLSITSSPQESPVEEKSIEGISVPVRLDKGQNLSETEMTYPHQFDLLTGLM